MFTLIIVGILICAAVIITAFLSKDNSCGFAIGVFMGGSVVMLSSFELYLIVNTTNPTPSALDVYRGKTELEIISVNGIPTDTIVVLKN